MDESTKVSSTLMEFGRSYRSILAAAEEEEDADEGFGEGDAKTTKRGDSTSASAAFDEETELRISTLLQEVSGGGAAGDLVTANLSAKMVGNIVGMQSEEIQRIALEYDVKK